MTVPVVFTAVSQSFSGSSFAGLQSSASNDGKVVAVLSTVGNNTLHVSKDSGVTFTGHTLATGSLVIKVSYDGTRIYVVLGSGSTYHINFSDDFGATFTPLSQTFSTTQLGFDVSDNGKYLAIIDGTNIYFSSDYGSSFSIIKNIPAGIHDLKLKSDGSTITALGASNTLHQTLDYGVTWNTISVSGTSVQNFAISDDLTHIVCSENKANGNICVSSNSGSSWNHIATTVYLAYCSISLDGKIILVSPNSTTDSIFISFNSGTTFEQAGPSSGGSFSTILGNYDFYTGYSISGSVYLYKGAWPKNVNVYGQLSAPIITWLSLSPQKVGAGPKTGGGGTSGTTARIIGGITEDETGFNLTSADGSLLFNAVLPAGAVPTDILTFRIDGQYVIVLFNGKILITYKLDPWTFPDLFVGNGWINWVDISNIYVNGGTPASIPAPVNGYKYNFIGRIFDSPIGYNDGILLLQAKQFRGVTVIFMPNGTHYSAEETENLDMINATKCYWGGRDYTVLNAEANMLNTSGYGDYLTDIS